MCQNICKRIGEAKAMAIIMNTPITPNNCGMCQSWSGIHHAIPYTVVPNLVIIILHIMLTLMNHKKINNTVNET